MAASRSNNDIASLGWDPARHATGLLEIDEQHKNLFAAVEELVAAFEGGAEVGQLHPLFDFLAQYVLDHFASEEQALASTESPLAARNRREHGEFIRRLEELRLRAAHGEDAERLVGDAGLWLLTWLSAHIEQVDRPLLQTA